MPNKKIIPIALALLISVLAVSYIAYRYMYIEQNTDIAPAISEKIKQPKPKGLIYMTLTPNDKEKLFSTTGLVRPRANASVSYASIDKYKGSAININFSSNSKWATFIADNPDDKTDKYIIVRARVDEKSKKMVNFQEIAIINNTATKPVISDTGHMLYAQSAQIKNSLSEAEDYSVYYVANDSIMSRKISTGIYPKWLNDKEYTVMKNDGIYVQSTTDINQKYILLANKNLNRKIENNVKYTLSNDKAMLALTDIDLGELSLFTINNVDKYTTSFLVSTRTRAFWPVISPDNAFIAVQSVESASASTSSQLVNPKLEFYRIESQNNKSNLVKLDYNTDLSKFVQTALFVDYWK